MSWRARAGEIVRRIAGGDAHERLERRVARMDSFALADWADTAVPGIGRALQDWANEGKPESLDEARMGTAALLVALEELHSRTAGRV